MDSVTIYDALYQLTSDEVEGELYGTCAPPAHEAFRRSLAGEAMPTIWFEVPLLGTPRFDLHVAYGNNSLHEGAPFASEAANGHGQLLNWYASEPREGAGLALAYDVGDGRVSNPAIHANVKGAASFDAAGFFAQVGRPDAAALYSGFAGRLPAGWCVWYFGVHPGRPGAPVRVDCLVDAALQQAYASDPTLLVAHLQQVGLNDAGPEAQRIGEAIAASPYYLELQFDLLADGLTGPTMALSAGLPLAPAGRSRPQWVDGGEAARLMGLAEELGMADDRWRHIPQALFTTSVNIEGRLQALYCVPLFVKYRMREGQPLDAKIYLSAGAKTF